MLNLMAYTKYFIIIFILDKDITNIEQMCLSVCVCGRVCVCMSVCVFVLDFTHNNKSIFKLETYTNTHSHTAHIVVIPIYTIIKHKRTRAFNVPNTILFDFAVCSSRICCHVWVEHLLVHAVLVLFLILFPFERKLQIDYFKLNFNFNR